MLDFIERWREKGRHYLIEGADSSVANHFDRFFTAFVLYNLLCKEINKSCRLGLSGDKNLAIQAARKLLTSEPIMANHTIRNCLTQISDLISGWQFYIRNEITDCQGESINKLKCNNPDRQAEGMLEIIYQIRCNMFHGDKNFVNNQRRILKPCIQIIEELNSLIIQKLNQTPTLAT